MAGRVGGRRRREPVRLRHDEHQAVDAVGLEDRGLRGQVRPHRDADQREAVEPQLGREAEQHASLPLQGEGRRSALHRARERRARRRRTSRRASRRRRRPCSSRRRGRAAAGSAVPPRCRSGGSRCGRRRWSRSGCRGSRSCVKDARYHRQPQDRARHRSRPLETGWRGTWQPHRRRRHRRRHASRARPPSGLSRRGSPGRSGRSWIGSRRSTRPRALGRREDGSRVRSRRSLPRLPSAWSSRNCREKRRRVSAGETQCRELAAGKSRVRIQEAIDVFVDEAAEGICRRLTAGPIGDGTSRTLEDLVGSIEDQVGFGREIVEDGLLGHPCGTGDVGHRHGVVPVEREEASRDVAQPVTCLAFLALPQPECRIHGPSLAPKWSHPNFMVHSVKVVVTPSSR